MNRFALTAAFALGLMLTACNNEPEEAEGSSDDSVGPTAPETANGDEVVSEGPTDDATPYAGTTGSTGGRATGGGGNGAGTSASGAGSSGTGSMTKGSASASGTRPPKGSKLQKADPR